jgi:hypothetical protein
VKAPLVAEGSLEEQRERQSVELDETTVARVLSA